MSYGEFEEDQGTDEGNGKYERKNAKKKGTRVCQQILSSKTELQQLEF